MNYIALHSGEIEGAYSQITHSRAPIVFPFFQPVKRRKWNTARFIRPLFDNFAE